MKKERRGGKSLESIAYAIEVGQGTKQERRGAEVTEEANAGNGEKQKKFWSEAGVRKLITAMKDADGDHDKFTKATAGKLKSRGFTTKDEDNPVTYPSVPFDNDQIIQKARSVKTMMAARFGVDLPMPKKKAVPAINYKKILEDLGYETLGGE